MLRRLVPWVVLALLIVGLALYTRAGPTEDAPPPPCAGTPVALERDGREAVYCLASASGAELARAAGASGPCAEALAEVGALEAGALLRLRESGAGCELSRGRMPAAQARLFGVPLDLNSASAEELEGLPGIGPRAAQAIVEDRERNGPFTSVEDLERVKGIGPKGIERLRGLVVAK